MGLRQSAIVLAAVAVLAGAGAASVHAASAARQGATPEAPAAATTPAAATPVAPEPATDNSTDTSTATATAAPEPTDVPAPAAAEPTAQPTAEPATGSAAPSPKTDVITLVAWYVNDPSGEFLNIFPIAVDPALVAGELAASQPVGVADFPEDGVPTVKLGETTFTSYSRSEGDIPERWTWFDDYEGARPATLVMQVEGAGGPYAGYYGTVTFISRDEGGVGGVIVFALRPPDSRQRSGDGQQAAGDEPASEAGSDAAGGADMPDPDVPDPTDAAAEPSA